MREDGSRRRGWVNFLLRKKKKREKGAECAMNIWLEFKGFNINSRDGGGPCQIKVDRFGGGSEGE